MSLKWVDKVSYDTVRYFLKKRLSSLFMSRKFKHSVSDKTLATWHYLWNDLKNNLINDDYEWVIKFECIFLILFNKAYFTIAISTLQLYFLMWVRELPWHILRGTLPVLYIITYYVNNNLYFVTVSEKTSIKRGHDIVAH